MFSDPNISSVISLPPTPPSLKITQKRVLKTILAHCKRMQWSRAITTVLLASGRWQYCYGITGLESEPSSFQ